MATKKTGEGQPGEIRVEVLPIDQAAMLDDNNINKHTPDGTRKLKNSLEKRGAFRSIASAGKGTKKPKIGAGNLTYATAKAAGVTEVVNVHIKKGQLVNVVRDDLSPNDVDFFALAIEDNQISKISYSPDPTILNALANEDHSVLANLRRNDRQFNELIAGMGLKSIDYSDIEKQFEKLAGMQDESIVISVPKKYRIKVLEWIANGETQTAAGLGRGIMKRAGILKSQPPAKDKPKGKKSK